MTDTMLAQDLRDRTRVDNTINVRVRDDEWRWLKGLAALHGCTMGEAIRQVIRRARLTAEAVEKEKSNGNQ